MLSLILMILLIGSFFIGLRRGFIMQLFHLISFFVSLIVAYVYYKDLADVIRLWLPYPQLSTDSTFAMVVASFDMEQAYYSGISFVLIFFVTKIGLHIIGSMFDFLARLPFLKTVNGLLGGILCFVEVYLLIFISLHVAALLPIEAVQDPLNRSSLAKWIIDHTPFLSTWIKDVWLGK